MDRLPAWALIGFEGLLLNITYVCPEYPEDPVLVSSSLCLGW